MAETIELPCKLDQTFYVVSECIPIWHSDIPYCYAGTVCSFRITSRGIYIKIRIEEDWAYYYNEGRHEKYYKYFNFPVSAIGKTIFYTKKEADEIGQKLKEETENAIYGFKSKGGGGMIDG